MALKNELNDKDLWYQTVISLIIPNVTLKRVRYRIDDDQRASIDKI